MFVHRFDVEIDKSEVVHHLTLNYDGRADDRYLYSWAPGAGAIEFPDGGLRIRPEDTFRLEIHYNNARALTGIVDRTGVVMHAARPAGKEYAMRYTDTVDIAIPSLSRASVTANCVAASDFFIIAATPHMHAHGTAFQHLLQRADGTKEMLVRLETWSFERQFFYDVGVGAATGDRLRMTCDYRNDTTDEILGGLQTSNEMCFNFMYVTPPTAQIRCPATCPPNVSCVL